MSPYIKEYEESTFGVIYFVFKIEHVEKRYRVFLNVFSFLGILKPNLTGRNLQGIRISLRGRRFLIISLSEVISLSFDLTG